MKKFLVGILFISFCCVGLTPFSCDSLAAEKNTSKVEKAKKKVSKAQQEENSERDKANPLYPAKYTPEYIENIKKEYNCSTKAESVTVALDLLKDTNGEFSRQAILGNNLTKRAVKIEFRDLKTINPEYDSFDALGWKRGRNLYIYINKKHENAPAIAIAPLLAHEALHQDEYNSLAEETYAWTMEAAVWCELIEMYSDYELNYDPLIQRENTLKKLFEKGNYTDKYIRKTVLTNDGYKKLPQFSPGFENL